MTEQQMYTLENFILAVLNHNSPNQVKPELSLRRLREARRELKVAFDD